MAADGWTKEEKQRGDRLDKYWIDPKGGKKCRSIIEVARKAYPELLEEAPQRPKKETINGPARLQERMRPLLRQWWRARLARAPLRRHAEAAAAPPPRRRGEARQAPGA